MAYETHLYEIFFPNSALVASQYNPEQFARHYTMGSTRHYSGKVIFAEIDTAFRNPYFDIEKGFAGLVPHEDGRPKATKFISCYRVLEHMDLDAIKKLYLVTSEGAILGLDPAPYDKIHQPDLLRVMVEITPMRMIVLSSMDFSQFAEYITNPENPKGAPKVLYTQIDLTIDDFLKDFENNPLMNSPIPSVHPAKLRDAIFELRMNKNKKTKGLSLDSNLNSKSYKYLRHGFMFAAQNKSVFFPIPEEREIEAMNLKFWKTM